jgi:glucokinase
MKKKEKVAIGLDVGGTKIAAGLITESGKILAYYKIPTFDERKPTAQSFIDRLIFLYDQLSHDAKALGVKVSGVGIASTGPMNVEMGTIIQPANLRGIPKIEVCKLFLKKRKVKLYFQNDAMAAAIAERRWGAARKTNNSVMITVGTGIGAGTLVNGQPLQNKGIGSEWGHCLLGSHSVEEISAGPALKKRAEKLVRRKINRLDEIPVKILRSPKNKKKVFGPTSLALAQLCTNLSIGIAPEVISFAGGVFDYGNFFWPELKKEYHRLMKDFKMFEAELVRSKVKHASLMGAGCLVFEEISAFS